MQRFTIRTSNISEEKIFTQLCPTLWGDLEKFGKVSSLPNSSGVDILITHQNINPPIKKFIQSTPLEPYVWAWEDTPIEEMIVKKAKEKNITFSFAESCTGGLVSSKVTDVSGASEVFLGTILSYSNEIKRNLLSVKKKLLKTMEPLVLNLHLKWL